jgi:SAM-dependent methyltransferase
MSAREDLLAVWRAELARPVRGWDLSELGERYVEQQPPWDYRDLAVRALRGAGSALDLGTGGGEVLLSLGDALPEDTVATEGWPPNLPVAAGNLTVRGIPVVAYDAESDPRLPFPDGRFDVVLDRHEAYVADEVHRVLRPGGRFLTQQVDGRDFGETQAIFGGRSQYSHITLESLRHEAVSAGFEVDAAEEWRGEARFSDVATLVRYFAYVPWEVPDDFGVDRYAAELLALHDSGAELRFTQRRFYLSLTRPRG